MSPNLIQFWHYLPRDSVRSPSLRAQSQRHSPFQVTIATPKLLHKLCFWPTACCWPINYKGCYRANKGRAHGARHVGRGTGFVPFSRCTLCRSLQVFGYRSSPNPVLSGYYGDFTTQMHKAWAILQKYDWTKWVCSNASGLGESSKACLLRLFLISLYSIASSWV